MMRFTALLKTLSQPRKKAGVFFIASVMAMLLTPPVFATISTDATGELFDAYPNLDIVSVEITNDLSDITFIITVSEDPLTNDWGRYMIAIDSQPGGLTNYNAWYPRPISLNSGLEYWFGCWLDGGGGRELYRWEEGSAAFDLILYPGGNPIVSGKTITVSIPLTSLGLSDGDTFVFDVFTSDGGVSNSAVDALSDPAETVPNWTAPYISTSALTYTVGEEPPPPPATLVIDREITGIVHNYTPPGIPDPWDPAHVWDELLFDTNGLSDVDLSQYDTFKLRLHAPAGQKLIVDRSGELRFSLSVYYAAEGDIGSHNESATLEFEQFTGTMPSNSYSLFFVGDAGDVIMFRATEIFTYGIEFSALSYAFTPAYNPTNSPKDFMQYSSHTPSIYFSYTTTATNDPGPFATIVSGVDTDGDGQSDYEEMIAGSNPNNSNEYFHVYDTTHEESGFVVSWTPCVTGRWYAVHWISDLTNSFLPLANFIDYPQSSWTDTTHNAEDAGFYKITVELK
jgi:hypothetical protein